MDFVASLGLYDVVCSYEEIETLPQTATVQVDMAGNVVSIPGSHPPDCALGGEPFAHVVKRRTGLRSRNGQVFGDGDLLLIVSKP